MRILVLAVCLSVATLAGTAPDPRIAVIEESAGDWNRGDIESFVQCYEQSPATTFVGARVSHGADQILARYRRDYPDKARMGQLTFTELEARTLTPELAIVTGRFTLVRSAEEGGRSTGLFTLVLRKGAAGWKIIHDHTSSAAGN